MDNKWEIYLREHKLKRIALGKSGADVYDVDGRFILKHVLRENIGDDERFEGYRKEYQFYHTMKHKNLQCVPEIFELTESEDEIVILMKKYQNPERKELKEELLSKIMHAIAEVHSIEKLEFLEQPHREPSLLSQEQIIEYLHGWQEVLNEYPGRFDEKPLQELARKINSIIKWQDGEAKRLCHGDFHMDNLLLDEGGNILICDWQSVSLGAPSGDLSFFISRLNSDGFKIDEKSLVALYAKAMKKYSGKEVDELGLLQHMHAANVITSFIFWHIYLHNSELERVNRIYTEMISFIL